MGIRILYINYIEKYYFENIGDMKSGSMLELGNQVMRGNKKPPEKTGKQYFENRGMEHVSIDLNGRHGSLKKDLSKPIINQDWINHFDVITNLGTTEHVEPHEGQYECFKNIHNFLSIGGILVNINPDADGARATGYFKSRHCNNYYSKEFFEMLAEENNYEILDSHGVNAYRWSCLKKTKDQPFMEDKDLFLSKILRRSGGKVYKWLRNKK